MYVSRLGKSDVIILLPSSIVFLELRLSHHKKARASTPRLSSACNGPGLIDPRVYLKIEALCAAPPEVANTGPGVNRGSGGGARGCGFEERVGVHARAGWVQFL